MANVHGGNLHHIYADTEILSARLLIILSMARYVRRLYLVYFCINVNIYWYKTQLYLLDSFNSSIIKTYWMYLNILLNIVQTI